jgi:hypothetical protein
MACGREIRSGDYCAGCNLRGRRKPSGLKCKVCGISIPDRDPDCYDDRCEKCISRAAARDEIPF